MKKISLIMLTVGMVALGLGWIWNVWWDDSSANAPITSLNKNHTTVDWFSFPVDYISRGTATGVISPWATVRNLPAGTYEVGYLMPNGEEPVYKWGYSGGKFSTYTPCGMRAQHAQLPYKLLADGLPPGQLLIKIDGKVQGVCSIDGLPVITVMDSSTVEVALNGCDVNDPAFHINSYALNTGENIKILFSKK